MRRWERASWSIADNRVDPATGSVEMKARFENTGDLLLPGQFVNVRLTLQTLSNATTIPVAAVNVGPDGSFAYVVGTDQTVSMRPIEVGQTEGTTAVITTGLQPGETVVTDGQMSLTAGLAVKATPPTPALIAGSAAKVSLPRNLLRRPREPSRARSSIVPSRRR